MATGHSLQQFGAYQKACQLFDQAVEDLSPLAKQPLTMRLVSQQIASADSIAANIEEGYGRRSRREYAQFLVIARGSTTETRGRCTRLKHWLPSGIVTARVSLCDEIVAILSATIRKLQQAG